MFKNFLFWHGQSGFWTLKLPVSEEWIHGINWFFACWYKFIQIKRCLKIFGVGMAKNRCGQCGDRTLKLTVPKEWTNGITNFLDVDTDSQKLKGDQNFFGWAWSIVAVDNWSWDSKIESISKVKRWNNSMIFRWVWSKLDTRP